MRVFRFGLTGLLIVQLLGCTLRQTKQAAAPPPPKPAAVTPPAAEPQPLSLPQTAVVLPSPQPVNPDAIPPAPAPPATPAGKPEAPAGQQRAARHASGPPKPDTEADTETPPVAAGEQQPFRPILSPDEQRRIASAIEARKREIADKLARAKGHLSGTDQVLADRIDSFLHQSEEAQQRGDFTQADSLSERALILARELSVE